MVNVQFYVDEKEEITRLAEEHVRFEAYIINSILHLLFSLIILVLRLIGVSSYVHSRLVQVKTSSTVGVNAGRIPVITITSA